MSGEDPSDRPRSDVGEEHGKETKWFVSDSVL